jgi:hypothetical protein
MIASGTFLKSLFASIREFIIVEILLQLELVNNDIFTWYRVYVVREPSVPERDRDGKLILSYPILDLIQ